MGGAVLSGGGHRSPDGHKGGARAGPRGRAPRTRVVLAGRGQGPLVTADSQHDLTPYRALAEEGAGLRVMPLRPSMGSRCPTPCLGPQPRWARALHHRLSVCCWPENRWGPPLCRLSLVWREEEEAEGLTLPLPPGRWGIQHPLSFPTVNPTGPSHSPTCLEPAPGFPGALAAAWPVSSEDVLFIHGLSSCKLWTSVCSCHLIKRSFRLPGPGAWATTHPTKWPGARVRDREGELGPGQSCTQW